MKPSVTKPAKSRAPVKRAATPPRPDTSKAVRIFATGRDDKRHKFVVVTKLDEEMRLNRDIESFGYIIDIYLENDSLITSIFKLTFRNKTGTIYYGDETFEEHTTNIYNKSIEVGELFTVEYDEDSEDIIFEVHSICNY